MRVTRAGWIFVLLTLVVLLAAFNTGKNLLYLAFAVMSAMIPLDLVLARRTLSRLEVRREAPSRVFQGDAVELTIVVKQPRWAVMPMVAVEDPGVAEAPVELELPPRSARSLRLVTRFPHRGVIEMSRLRVWCDLPFGFVRFRRTFRLADRIIVYPRFRPLARLPARLLYNPREGGRRSTRRLGSGLNYLGIREHRPEDGISRIHWKSSARLGKLMVKEYEREGDYHYCVVLDPDYPAAELPLDPEHPLELGVRLAAALCEFLLRQGYEISLVAPDGPLDPGVEPEELLLHRPDLFGVLEALARARPAPGLDGGIIVGALAERLEQGTMLLLITSGAAGSTLTALQRAQAAGAAVLVLTPAPGGSGGVDLETFRRAGIPAVRIAEESGLEDFAFVREAPV
jgi:uncharacterized protein (DUF58 family)